MGGMPVAGGGFELPPEADDFALADLMRSGPTGTGDAGDPDAAEGGFAEGGFAEGGFAEGGFAEGGFAEGGFAEGGFAEGEAAGGEVAGVEPPLELGVDEFDDFEILAEADADDEDLLASHGEHDASGRRELGARPVTGERPATGERRPSELDFAARLDLGDDSDLYLGSPSDPFAARHVIDSLQDEATGQHEVAPGDRFAGAATHDPHALSAGAALAAFETGDDAYEAHDDSEVTDDPDAHEPRAVRPIFDPDPSSSFTLAGIPSDSIDLEPPSQRRAEPIEPPRPARRPGPLTLHEAPVEDHELEHALEALDVDLDDLAIPHAATQLQRERSRPVAAHPPSRAPAPAPAPPARASVPTPAPSPRAPAPTPAPPTRSFGPTPVPQTRPFAPPPPPQARPFAPTPAPQSRPSGPTPAPQTRPFAPTPAPQTRAPAPTPSRVVRPTGPGAPGPRRVVAPRAPSEGVDIDFDDED